MQKAYSYMSALIYVTGGSSYSECTLFYVIRFLFIIFSTSLIRLNFQFANLLAFRLLRASCPLLYKTEPRKYDRIQETRATCGIHTRKDAHQK